MKAWIGIDNGVSGSLAFVNEEGKVKFAPTPTKSEQNYTKTKQNITRIHGTKLYSWLLSCIECMPNYHTDKDRLLVVIERPMVNPGRFKATTSALRAFEATLIVCESLLLPTVFMDSKEWQRAMLPSGLEKEDLKTASLEIGKRMFPQFQDSKQKDRDSLLMAEYARRNSL